MSYILDALKKSEAERQQGKAPGIGTVQSYKPNRGKRRRTWPYLLVIALAVNAGVVLMALRPWEARVETPPKAVQEPGMSEAKNARQWHPSQSPEAGPPREKLAAEPPEAAPSVGSARAPSSLTPADSAGKGEPSVSVPPAGQAAVSSSTEPAGTTEIAAPAAPPPNSASKTAAAGVPSPPAAAANREGKTISTTAAQAEDRFGSKLRDRPPGVPAAPVKKPAAAQQSFATAPPTVPRAAEATNSRPVVTQSPAVEKAQRPAAPPAPVEERPAPDPMTPRRGEPAQHKALSRPQGTKELYDMPPGIRHEVPRLTFSFLVYSDRPEERMVTINGRRMREGEEVTSGLRLEEITPEGAILSWKGQRFHKSVF